MLDMVQVRIHTCVNLTCLLLNCSFCQIEATFRDGTKLVTLHHPICVENGNLALALAGSMLPVPDVSLFAAEHPEEGLVPGEIITPMNQPLLINQGRECVNLKVTNTADRPIQVGSHYHFIETNPYLRFDRRLAYGMRLNMCVTLHTAYSSSLHCTHHV